MMKTISLIIIFLSLFCSPAMSFVLVTDSQTYIGTESETKPTTDVKPGAVFKEKDTGMRYVFDGSVWNDQTSANTHTAHVHHDMWNHFAFLETGDTSTIASVASKNTYTITLDDATGFTVNNFVDIHSGGTHAHVFRKIIAVNGNILTFGSHLDLDHAIGETVNEVVFNMATSVGTIASPVIFAMPAATGEIIHVDRFLVTLEHESAGDFSKFGSRAAFINGLQIRVNRNNGEEYETHTIWRTNKDMKEDMYSVEFNDKAGGGDYGTSGRWTLTESSMVIRLDGDNNDKIEFLVSDDMTTGAELLDVQVKAQGHYEVGGRD